MEQYYFILFLAYCCDRQTFRNNQNVRNLEVLDAIMVEIAVDCLDSNSRLLQVPGYLYHPACCILIVYLYFVAASIQFSVYFVQCKSIPITF